MRTADVMKGAPPSPEALVRLSNWRQHPYNRWSFRNVRQILPTAEIRRAAVPRPLEGDFQDLGGLCFANPSGQATTLSNTLDATHTDGLLVLRRGRLVTEWYGEGMTPQTQHLLFSVSKSIAGTLAGALVERGLLDVDAPVVRYLPEVEGSVYAGCTVRHLLDMTVAIDFEEDYADPDGDVVRYRLSTGWDVRAGHAQPSDLRGFLCTLRGTGKPHGAVFDYVSPNTDVLGWVFERAAGLPYAQILSQCIWQPMGAEDDASITVDSQGAGRVAGGISATLRDLARFGEMVRTGGVANGCQVIPRQWIDDIRRNGDARAFAASKLAEVFPGGRYRSKWYGIDAERGNFAAVGIHGQWIYIDPRSDVVIVKQASQPVPMDIATDHLWLRAYAAIVDHLAPGL